MIALVVTQFVGTFTGVNGVSMMPNLRHGERVLIPKYETWLHRAGVGEFRRGDILVFRPPTVAGVQSGPLGLWSYRPFLIKRLVALPGDTVRVEGGRVWVNGTEVAQNFTTDYWREQGCLDTTSDLANLAQSAAAGLVQDARDFRVPRDGYFVMGDNRTRTGSEDSRLFGPVARRDVAGRAALVVWPPVRRVEATYDCAAGGRPQDHVTYAGPSRLNLRVLSPPDAFRLP